LLGSNSRSTVSRSMDRWPDQPQARNQCGIPFGMPWSAVGRCGSRARVFGFEMGPSPRAFFPIGASGRGRLKFEFRPSAHGDTAIVKKLGGPLRLANSGKNDPNALDGKRKRPSFVGRRGRSAMKSTCGRFGEALVRNLRGAIDWRAIYRGHRRQNSSAGH